MGGFAVHEALGEVGGFAADDADGLEFVDLIGLGEEERHGAERFPTEVHIQPGDEDAHATLGELVGDLGDFLIEELGFVNTDDGGVALQVGEDVAGAINGQGFKDVTIVGGNFFDGVAVVNDGFEDLDFLASDGGAAQAADEFVGFAAEHGADDDFDGAVVVFHLGWGWVDGEWWLFLCFIVSLFILPSNKRPLEWLQGSLRIWGGGVTFLGSVGRGGGRRYHCQS